jgi:hypothetical protein
MIVDFLVRDEDMRTTFWLYVIAVVVAGIIVGAVAITFAGAVTVVVAGIIVGAGAGIVAVAGAVTGVAFVLAFVDAPLWLVGAVALVCGEALFLLNKRSKRFNKLSKVAFEKLVCSVESVMLLGAVCGAKRVVVFLEADFDGLAQFALVAMGALLCLVVFAYLVFLWLKVNQKLKAKVKA